jgi:protein-tyrosine phosphatase
VGSQTGGGVTGGLVDIHAHLLPGIDDGPEDLPGSLEMAQAAVGAGIETVVATPHLRDDFPGVHVEELAERCGSLQDEVTRAGISLRIVSGAEVSLAWALEADEGRLRLASFGQRGKDLLVETPGVVSSLDRMLGHLAGRGYRITLAHPERSSAFQRDPERLERLVAQGVLLQVNASSVLDRRGNDRSRLGLRLCRDGLAHAVASDGHRARSWRPIVNLASAVESLSSALGPERAHWLTASGPAAIVEGVSLPALPPADAPQRRRWFAWRRAGEG